ncbi:MAG TPA: hypothetical protein VIN05_14490 [Roseovarius sp.]
MHRAFTRSRHFRQPAAPMNGRPALALDITDMGADDGIDVMIHDENTGRILFESVLVDPESRVLLTHGSPETEAFWQCLHARGRVDRDRHLFLTARCRFSLLTAAIFTKRMGRAEVRNVRFLRLVEEMLDELQTREPWMSVEVAVTHRNPAIANCITY